MRPCCPSILQSRHLEHQRCLLAAEEKLTASFHGVIPSPSLTLQPYFTYSTAQVKSRSVGIVVSRFQ